MVIKKTKKVEKKSIGSTASSPKKTTTKTTSKKKSTEQKKKSPVKKATVSKVKKSVAKKDTRTSVKTKKTTTKKNTSSVTEKKKLVKKPVKKQSGSVASTGKASLGIKKASKSELKKVDKVIGNLSKTSGQTKAAPVQRVAPKEAVDKKTKQSFVTTMPGVFRRVPAAKKTTPGVHQPAPIQGIMNYLKNIV